MVLIVSFITPLLIYCFMTVDGIKSKKKIRPVVSEQGAYSTMLPYEVFTANEQTLPVRKCVSKGSDTLFSALTTLNSGIKAILETENLHEEDEDKIVLGVQILLQVARNAYLEMPTWV